MAEEPDTMQTSLNGHCPTTTCYDVIVIGSGMGGLTAAGLLVKAGKSVLLLEKPNGLVVMHTVLNVNAICLMRGTFNQWLRIGGDSGGQVIRRVLQALEVEQQVRFIPVNPFAHVDYPDFSMDLPLTIDAFVMAMAVHFPDQAEGLRVLAGLCLEISEQAAIADEVMNSQDGVLIQEQLSLLLKYRHATLAEVWTDYIQDPNYKAFLQRIGLI